MNVLCLIVGRQKEWKGKKSLLAEAPTIRPFHTLEKKFQKGTLVESMRTETCGWLVEAEGRGVMFSWFNTGEPLCPPFILLTPQDSEHDWYNIEFRIKRLKALFKEANTFLCVPRWLDSSTRNPSFKALRNWSRQLADKHTLNYELE